MRETEQPRSVYTCMAYAWHVHGICMAYVRYMHMRMQMHMHMHMHM